MKLDLAVLSDHLPKEFRCSLRTSVGQSLNFSRPNLFVPGYKLQPNSFLVLESSALRYLDRKQPVPGLVCVGKELPDNWLQRGIPILQIAGSVGLLEVYQAVLAVYDSFDDWERGLLQQLSDTEHFDVRQILRLGVQMLNNPVAIMDASLHIPYRAWYDTADDGSLQIRLSDQTIPLDIVSSENIKRGCQLERKIREPYLSEVLSDNQRSFCMNFYYLNQFMGCAWVQEEYRPFLDSDFSLAAYFFQYLQQGYLRQIKQKVQDDDPRSHVLLKLLQTQPVPPEQMQLFSLAADHVWLAFQLSPQKQRKTMPPDYLAATLNMLLHEDICAFVYNDAVIGVLQTTLSVEESIPFCGQMDILKRMEYIAGFSSPFQDIRLFPKYLLQADFALTCAENESLPYILFRNRVLLYLLTESATKLDSTTILPDGMVLLMQRDADRNSELVKTLACYLEHEMSISQTASALYIQRSSLVKRLNTIHKLIPEDLTQPDIRLHYRLCFAMLHRGLIEKTSPSA